MATVRYLVNDVQASVDFYTKQLGFELEQQFGPAMAILRRGDATLWLAGPQSSAAKPMPDGKLPWAWDHRHFDQPAGYLSQGAPIGCL